jgi:hypothetical protein
MKPLAKLLITILFFNFITLVHAQENSLENQITSPLKHFGFQPGEDRMLFSYDQLINYLKILDEESPRIELREIGESYLGKKMYLVFLTSQQNIENLETLKQLNKELALNPYLSESQMVNYIDKGKVFIFATLSMHSNEVGPTQSAPLIAWEIATTNNPQILEWLDNVVLMMVPNANPDGMKMVVEHYMDSKGTAYEGGDMPMVYNKYVGHDNNRDFVNLTQKENKAIAQIFNRAWFPQVHLDKHQMGSDGPRYVTTPSHDPVSENIDERLLNWQWIFGSNMATDMAEEGLSGVSLLYQFDDYYPGYITASQWKNVISIFTECASVQYAKPVFVEKNELVVYGKGLSEYEKSIKMPKPWTGGWWRLSDIVEYETASTWSVIKTASIHKEEILSNRNELCKKEIEKGKKLVPAYYIIPEKQHDASELVALLNLLNEHGIKIYKINAETAGGGQIIEKGDYVLPLSQPFRSFIKEVMEKQEFPERHYTPGGKLIAPYDISSWSLPLHRGIKTWQIDHVNEEIESSIIKLEFPIIPKVRDHANAKFLLFPVSNNESYKAAFNALTNGIKVYRANNDLISGNEKINQGDFLIEMNAKSIELKQDNSVSPIPIFEELKEGLESIKLPALGLIESNFHDMDTGWTRFIFDCYGIPFKVLKPADINENKLDEFDILIFPDIDKNLLLKGQLKSEDGAFNILPLDPKYTVGIQDTGVLKLFEFVNDGGQIISWGESCNLFFGIQSLKTSDDKVIKFQLPVKDITSSFKKKGFNCPGSLLNVELIKDHPLTLGMESGTKVVSQGRPILTTSIPYFDMDRRVIARFPKDKVLASGFIQKEELLYSQSAMVWVKKGKGQFIFYGFSPLFRASTQGSYKLLFNALLLK